MRQPILMIAALLAASVACAQDHVWTVDRATGGIQVFTTDGALTTTFAAPVNSSINGMTISESGEAFFADWGLGQIWRLNVAGTINTTYPMNQVASLSFLPSGDLWATQFSSFNLYRANSNGQVVATVTLPSFARNAVTTTHHGEAYVADDTRAIYRIVNDAIVATFATAIPTGSVRLAAEQSGDCWAVYDAGSVIRWSRTLGTAMTTVNVPNPQALAVNGANEVYLATQAPNTLYRLTATGAVITSIGLSYSPTNVALDGNGDVWVFGATGLRKHDPFTLSVVQTTGFAVSNTIWHGEMTRFVTANILDRSSDSDNDTIDNYAEAQAGSNPYNARSTPTTPQPIVNNPASIGTTLILTARFASDALLGYAVRGSLGNNPQNYIPVPNTQRVMPLENDAFYNFLQNSPSMFQNIDGFLDANGNTLSSFTIPSDSQLIGVAFYFAFVTLDNALPIPIKTISDNVTVTIRP